MNNNLNNYFMKPTNLKDIPIYPIKLMDYEEFSLLANQYILLDIPQLNNKLKQEGKDELPFNTLFEYLVTIIEDEFKILGQIKKNFNQNSKRKIPNKELEEMIREKYSLNSEVNICRLLNMTLHKDISFNKTMRCFAIADKGKIIGVINDSNFYEYRKIVMEQNLLFTPLIAPTKQAQRYIDAKVNGNSTVNSDIEAMIAFVSTNTNKDYSECTYYRFKADFYSLVKQLNRSDVVHFSAGGSTKKNGEQLDIPNISEKLGVDENPYDNVFTINE